MVECLGIGLKAMAAQRAPPEPILCFVFFYKQATPLGSGDFEFIFKFMENYRNGDFYVGLGNPQGGTFC